jgi:hypothetical protein
MRLHDPTLASTVIDLDRARAWVIIAVTCFAVLSPLVPAWRGRKDDSFPLSWYPMFASARPAFERPTYVYAWAPDGERAKLDVTWWTSGGFNQGRNMLTSTLEAGLGPTADLCARLAKKVGEKRGDRWARMAEVRIVRGKYDRMRFFAHGIREPLSEKVLYACSVPR